MNTGEPTMAVLRWRRRPVQVLVVVLWWLLLLCQLVVKADNNNNNNDIFMDELRRDLKASNDAHQLCVAKLMAIETRNDILNLQNKGLVNQNMELQQCQAQQETRQRELDTANTAVDACQLQSVHQSSQYETELKVLQQQTMDLQTTVQKQQAVIEELRASHDQQLQTQSEQRQTQLTNLMQANKALQTQLSTCVVQQQSASQLQQQQHDDCQNALQTCLEDTQSLKVSHRSELTAQHVQLVQNAQVDCHAHTVQRVEDVTTYMEATIVRLRQQYKRAQADIDDCQSQYQNTRWQVFHLRREWFAMKYNDNDPLLALKQWLRSLLGSLNNTWWHRQWQTTTLLLEPLWKERLQPVLERLQYHWMVFVRDTLLPVRHQTLHYWETVCDSTSTLYHETLWPASRALMDYAHTLYVERFLPATVAVLSYCRLQYQALWLHPKMVQLHQSQNYQKAVFTLEQYQTRLWQHGQSIGTLLRTYGQCTRQWWHDSVAALVQLVCHIVVVIGTTKKSEDDDNSSPWQCTGWMDNNNNTHAAVRMDSAVVVGLLVGYILLFRCWWTRRVPKRQSQPGKQV